MAKISPFKAWRFNSNLSEQIESLTSPLFDVVNQNQLDKLYQNPLNSIHLSVPSSTDNATEILDKWKTDGTLQQDLTPCIYVYYQYFTLPGSSKEYCRKGFISFIHCYDWDKSNVLLRHENTIPGAVNDRVDLLRQTQLNVSPTHGLYSDTKHELDAYMDECIKSPIYDTEDYQGVRDVLGVIHDEKVIQKFIDVLADKQVILADGHHRYEGSLFYKKEKEEEGTIDPEAGYNYHMMYLTNIESDDLRILPTHRLIKGLPDFDEKAFLEKLETDFTIKTVENSFDLYEIILGKPWAFGLKLPSGSYKLRLKPESFQKMEWKFPEDVKKLDLTVMHYFIIEKALGIPGAAQRRSTHVTFERNFSTCIAEVMEGKAQAALITKDISIEEVKRVCFSGYTMPQKSTYFYPKVICGFLFGSIKDDEFKHADYPGL